MDKILATLQTTLQRLDLHPVADHFTIGLLIVGVLIDLFASLVPARIWVRYTALTLMILGSISAGVSYFTGDLEADRIFDAMSEPAKLIFQRHAKLGTYMAVVFAVLAIWRILIQGVTFFAGTRSIYLILAVISAGILLYIGSLGGKMVYTYGVGTALMSAPAQPSAVATLPAAESLPTVSVPMTATPTPVPAVTATSTPTATVTATSTPHP